MTSIAGAVGSAGEELKRYTIDLLQEQHRFGAGRPLLDAMGGAVFGTRPFRGSTPPEAFGPLLVVADIRIDNRTDVTGRLALGRDVPDQTMLAQAWQMAGERCLDWLVGDFAFAIFDRNSQTLFLARDPTGQRPLHYARTSRAIFFASMPAAFRAVLGPLEADVMTVATLAAQLPNRTERSYFEAVNRVRPGELVRIPLSGQLQRRIYWNPSVDAKLSADRPELIEEFRGLLETAVGARIAHCKRPVATHLSSGFDSSSVTATAARLLKSPDAVIAFTSAPLFDAPMPADSGRFADESSIAGQTAAMHRIRNVIVREVPPVPDVIRDYGPLLQIPMTGAINMPWWVEIRKQASELGANCVLTAEMGNQSLNLGGLRFLAEWVRRRAWGTLFRQLTAAGRATDSRARGVLMSAFAPWLPRVAVAGLERGFLGTRPYREVSFLRPEWQAAADRAADTPGRSSDAYADTLNLIRIEDFGEFRKAAVASHGVEEMDPMSDRRLLEFALRLPPEHLYWDGINRPLMREALADRLPPAVFQAPGRGMQGADWTARLTRNDARSMLEEMSTSRTAHQLFDLESMRLALEEWPTADWNQLPILQRFLTALVPSLAIGMFLAGLERPSGR